MAWCRSFEMPKTGFWRFGLMTVIAPWHGQFVQLHRQYDFVPSSSDERQPGHRSPLSTHPDVSHLLAVQIGLMLSRLTGPGGR